MIGVEVQESDRDVACEFFQLFKTPWEFARAGRHYDVLLHAGDRPRQATGKLVLLYAGRKTSFDRDSDVRSGLPGPGMLAYLQDRIPVYGETATFAVSGNPLLLREDSKQCAAYLTEANDSITARIGYDLFSEVRSLLRQGQPTANAGMPSIELHIALLRDVITGCGLSLLEIPPVPDGHPFVVCLTHDVDHPSIRQHKWDHTMFGFLTRATFGSLLRALRGQLATRDLLENWKAALQLPFIHLGWAQDFWRDFADRYLQLEMGNPSTFFVIPFAGRAGKTSQGSAPALRASRYGAQDVADAVQKLQSAHCEVGVHGIDLWLDSELGRQELEEVRRVAGKEAIGVRMHWLYYRQQSAATAEAAGAAYDSTVGYNDTVGYRAGTAQVYKPLDATRLLELPLHVMDTAMFYPSYLNLSTQQARMQVRRLADNAERFGGALTINWHDRSVAPERLWTACYRDLIEDLKARGAWFATAGQAVSWFRKRRAVVFETTDGGEVRALSPQGIADGLPGLRLRTHRARNASSAGSQRREGYLDAKIAQGAAAQVGLQVGK